MSGGVFGHKARLILHYVIRKSNNSALKKISEGRMDGKKTHAKPRKKLLDWLNEKITT